MVEVYPVLEKRKYEIIFWESGGANLPGKYSKSVWNGWHVRWPLKVVRFEVGILNRGVKRVL